MQAKVFLLFLLVFASNVAAVNFFSDVLNGILGPVINLINDLLGDDQTNPSCPSDCPLGSCSCDSQNQNCECLIPGLPEDPNPCQAECPGGCGIGEYCGCDSSGCNCSCRSAQCNDAIDCGLGLAGEQLVCCGGQCTNPLLDPSNCGLCGNSCDSGYLCLGGACVSTSCDPASGVFECPGVGTACCPVQGQTLCVSLIGDPSNCGSCGNLCDIGSEICFQGTCTSCGNGSCEQELGENCFNCAECSCGPGMTCQETAPGSGVYTCQ